MAWLVVVVVAAAPTSASAQSASGSGALVPVTPGINAAAVPGAVPFGSTPASTPETVSFIFRAQNLQQLEAAVTGGITNYLSVRQFASEYGANPAVISALRSYLAQFGITTTVYADNLDVVAQGTAGEFDKALSVTQQQYHAPAVLGRGGRMRLPAQTFHGTAQWPQLPGYIANNLLAILGLTNYSPFGSQMVHVDTSVLKPQSGSSSYCLALVGLPNACNLPSNFAANYGLEALYKKGADGAGQTIAIVTLAALDPGAAQYFWQNVAHIPTTGRTLTVNNIDGGPGAPSDASGSGETDLDVEQSGGLAPGANVIVYQAPNTDYGFADAFFAAASQNIAGSVSSSWLESETFLQYVVDAGEESPGYAAAFDEAFLEMAAQGQSGFICSGDWAAYTASVDLGTTNLSVGISPDSPYITAAGGTTLPWSGTFSGPDGTAAVNVPAQRTWGWDYLWQPIATVTGQPLATVAESLVAGSGGGFSTIEPRPSYQYDVPGIGEYFAVQYLTPIDYVTQPGTNLVEPTEWSFNATPGVTRGYSSGRAVPDVSTDADPESGYLLYEPSAAGVGEPLLQGGWGGSLTARPRSSTPTSAAGSGSGTRRSTRSPPVGATHSPY
jgi:kumamolisin